MAKKKRKLGKKRMKATRPIVVAHGREDPIKHDETFQFQCQRCGECCHRLSSSLPLEAIDIFRLARHLKSTGHLCDGDIATVITDYTDVQRLTTNGSFAFFMKTEAPRDKCVFLDGTTCAVQEAKPRACRVYPLSARPNEEGDALDMVIVSRKMHHFTGPDIYAGDWLNECFDAEDQEFSLYEPDAMLAVEQRLRKIAGDEGLYERAFFLIMMYKYFLLDVDKPFMPQYRQNIAALLERLDAGMAAPVVHRGTGKEN